MPARLTHVGPIASKMREEDRRECLALGRSPKDALRMGLRASLVAITAMEGDRPLAMMGVVPTAILGGRGMVWMLGTEDVFRYGGDLLVRGPAIISDWLTMFERLENIVSAENAKAIRLLKRWGFSIGDKAEVHRGVEFLSFHIKRAAIQEQSLAA